MTFRRSIFLDRVEFAMRRKSVTLKSRLAVLHLSAHTNEHAIKRYCCDTKNHRLKGVRMHHTRKCGGYRGWRLKFFKFRNAKWSDPRKCPPYLLEAFLSPARRCPRRFYLVRCEDVNFSFGRSKITRYTTV